MNWFLLLDRFFTIVQDTPIGFLQAIRMCRSNNASLADFNSLIELLDAVIALIREGSSHNHMPSALVNYRKYNNRYYIDSVGAPAPSSWVTQANFLVHNLVARTRKVWQLSNPCTVHISFEIMLISVWKFRCYE